MSAILAISRLSPLAQGRTRRVYQHPDHSDWLIKILRPEIVQEWEDRKKSFGGRFRFRRLGPFSVFAREVEEYFSAHASEREAFSFAQKIVGIVETDLGPGIVVEAARDREGRLAPTVADLVKRKAFGPAEQKALLRAFDAIINSSLVVTDLHWRNLVYTFSEEHGDHFVMIDGLGSANPLPLKTWFPYFNRRSKLLRFRYLKTKLASAMPREQLLPDLLP